MWLGPFDLHVTIVVKKKSLFDDRPVEIQELTFVVKQDIGALNDKIGEGLGFIVSLFCYWPLNPPFSPAAQLGQYVASQQRQQPTKNKQASDFTTQVIVGLQSKLASTSSSFKDILEVRTQNMKAQKDRREQFSVNPVPMNKSPGLQQPFSSPFFFFLRAREHEADNLEVLSAPTSALYRRQNGSPVEKEDFVAIDMGTQAQSMELAVQQDNYSDARHEEIRNIENTINQLGSIFQQLATLVAQQGDQVQT